jgi:hypothetical protein
LVMMLWGPVASTVRGAGEALVVMMLMMIMSSSSSGSLVGTRLGELTLGVTLMMTTREDSLL